MLEGILQKLGLNDKEVQVYLTLLGIGTQPASTIAYRINMPRNTARFHLDRLYEKGFARKSKRGNTQLYTSESPENIIKALEIKKNKMSEKIDQQINQLQTVSAELKSKMQPTGDRPKITFYEGDEGLIKVYEDTLTSTETLRSFANYDTLHGILPEYFKTYFTRRTKKMIQMRSIHPATKSAQEARKRDKEELRESVLIPADKYFFSPEIQFYDNKVSITSLKEKLGIIIESHEIYEYFVMMFEYIWQAAKK
jgi:sugar-specific transcriptional regulator TrmB